MEVSHGAFEGAYSAFNRFRQAICDAMGGGFPPHKNPVHEDGTELDDNVWYWGDGYSEESHPGLFVLLSHSDCDGEISPEDCEKVANELEALLPKILGNGSGHIAAQGGFSAVTRKFIDGCILAAEENEPLVFG